MNKVKGNLRQRTQAMGLPSFCNSPYRAPIPWEKLMQRHTKLKTHRTLLSLLAGHWASCWHLWVCKGPLWARKHQDPLTGNSTRLILSTLPIPFPGTQNLTRPYPFSAWPRKDPSETSHTVSEPRALLAHVAAPSPCCHIKRSGPLEWMVGCWQHVLLALIVLLALWFYIDILVYW